MYIVNKEFVDNVWDPDHPQFEENAVSKESDPEKRKQLLQFMRDYVNSHIKGEPSPTPAKTAEELKSMGIIGLYRTKGTRSTGELKSDPVFKRSADEYGEAKRAPRKPKRTALFHQNIPAPPPVSEKTIDDYDPDNKEE